MRDGLETKYGKKIDGTHMIVPWVIMHAGSTLNRYKVGEVERQAIRD